MASKMVGIELSRGERVRLETPGGGGYGSAQSREPHRVAEDVRLGYISAGSAREDYACVVSPAGKLDLEATRTLRAEADGAHA